MYTIKYLQKYEMSQKITLHVSDLLLREDVVVENYQRVLADNFLIDCKIATKSEIQIKL